MLRDSRETQRELGYGMGMGEYKDKGEMNGAGLTPTRRALYSVAAGKVVSVFSNSKLKY